FILTSFSLREDKALLDEYIIRHCSRGRLHSNAIGSIVNHSSSMLLLASTPNNGREKHTKNSEVARGRNMQGTPLPAQPPTTNLNAAVLRKAIGRYYKEPDEYKGKADYELALR